MLHGSPRCSRRLQQTRTDGAGNIVHNRLVWGRLTVEVLLSGDALLSHAAREQPSLKSTTNWPLPMRWKCVRSFRSASMPGTAVLTRPCAKPGAGGGGDDMPENADDGDEERPARPTAGTA